MVKRSIAAALLVVAAVPWMASAEDDEGPCGGPNATQPTRNVIHASHGWAEETGIPIAQVLHEFECVGSSDPD